MGRIFGGIFLCTQLFVMSLFLFCGIFLEYSIDMEQKHNKQLNVEEYSVKYYAHGQQIIYEVISGMFLEYSAL